MKQDSPGALLAPRFAVNLCLPLFQGLHEVSLGSATSSACLQVVQEMWFLSLSTGSLEPPTSLPVALADPMVVGVGSVRVLR